jgi:hypothetical protein
VIGMPSTGGSSFGAEVGLLTLIAIAGAAAGIALRRRRMS